MSLGATDSFLEEGELLFKNGDYLGASKTWEVGLGLARSTKNDELIVVFLSNLGSVYSKIGDYDLARKCFEEEIKLAKSFQDKNILGISYRDLGNFYREIHEDSDATEYLRKALDIFNKTANERGKMRCFADIGRVYVNLKNYKTAISHFSESRAIAEKLQEHRLIIENILNTAYVYMSLGGYREAMDGVDEAIKKSVEFGHNDCEAKSVLGKGSVFLSMGNYSKAISCFERSLSLAQSVGDKNIIGCNLANIGLVYKNIRFFERAINYLENSQKFFTDIGYKDMVIENYTNLAGVYRSIGHYEEAFRYFNEALKLYSEEGNKRNVCAILVNLGLLHNEQGQFRKATEYYEYAIEMRKEMKLPHEDIDILIADVCLDKGEIKVAQKACKRIKDPLRLARLNLMKKNYATASEYYEKAIRENVSEWNTGQAVSAYCGLAQSKLGFWEYTTAKELFGQAVTMVEAERERLDADEKANFFDFTVWGIKRTEPYEGLVRTYMSMNDAKGAFRHSENLKLQEFAELTGANADFRNKQLPSAIAEKEEDLLTALRGVRKEMDVLYKNDRKDEYWSREKELKYLESKKQDLIEQIRRDHPWYASVKYPEAVNVHEIKINPDEVLVEFEVTKYVTYLFVYRGYDKRFTARTIGKTRDEIDELVRKYMSFFKKSGQEGELSAFEPAFSHDFFEILFGDILSGTPKGAKLVIVPDESLGVVPFSSLVTSLPVKDRISAGRYGSYPVGVNYLGDKYDITYAQSVTSLMNLRAHRESRALKSTDAVLVMSEPVTSLSDDETVSVSGIDKMIKEALLYWRHSKDDDRDTEHARTLFPARGFSKAMADMVLGIFGGNGKIMSGANASEESVFQMPLDKYGYVSFCTNCIMDPTAAWIRQPAIILTQNKSFLGEYDGFLTVEEIMNLRMAAHTVALPGSDICYGGNINGDGAMMMGRAFQTAGCRNVLMRLWGVDCEVCEEYSKYYIRNIRNGAEATEAMRQAKSELRANGYEHPYYWAPFIVVSR
ncbi:MAG: tetratricopeptide repeat protein [Endomicrobiales bacterium]|nr:tetratricopeptide repeat protein [Endomicrobiales bacterium]